MTIRDQIQEAMKQALKSRDQARLETLRMAKGALLLKEKEKAREAGLSDDETVSVLRAEVRKRRQSRDVYAELGKTGEVEALEQEIRVIELFLPRLLALEELEERVRAYLAEHPDMNHPGKLTGALKKELGERADGKELNEVCRRVLGV